jgi:hypothetical protein
VYATRAGISRHGSARYDPVSREGAGADHALAGNLVHRIDGGFSRIRRSCVSGQDTPCAKLRDHHLPDELQCAVCDLPIELCCSLAAGRQQHDQQYGDERELPAQLLEPATLLPRDLRAGFAVALAQPLS